MKFKYVNASDQVVYLPNPRGGRLALAPGQFVVDSYYERYGRLPHEKPSANKVLLKVAIEGPPTTVDNDIIGVVKPMNLPKIRFQTSLSTVGTNNQSVQEDGSCITACEVACMTVREFGISPEPTEQQRTQYLNPVPSEPNWAETRSLEANTDTVLNPMETTLDAGSSNKADSTLKLFTTQEVLARHGYAKEDVTQDREYYVFIAREGQLLYLSKLDLNFTCKKRADMLNHIKQLTGG